MDYIQIRKRIQENGDELYHSLGETSRNLQYLAGELMSGNEEFIRRLMVEGEPFTIGADDMLNTGFTVNQKAYLEELEKELNYYKTALRQIEDSQSLIDEGLE